MVIGVDKFKEYFKEYTDAYVIIGGTACDIIIEDAGFEARTTKDIDIILVVEALTPEFVKKFWQFVKDANYERKERSDDARQYYRFAKPKTEGYPKQIELFSKKPDGIKIDDNAHLTPIPADDDLSSLSAILLSEDYYKYMVEHSSAEDGIRKANIEALIALKAKAYLEIKDRIAKGGKEDAKHIKKHKEDVYRLAVMLPSDADHELPDTIKKHVKEFTDEAGKDLPDNGVLERMGLTGGDIKKVHEQLIKTFNLTV